MGVVSCFLTLLVTAGPFHFLAEEFWHAMYAQRMTIEHVGNRAVWQYAVLFYQTHVCHFKTLHNWHSAPSFFFDCSMPQRL